MRIDEVKMFLVRYSFLEDQITHLTQAVYKVL